MIGSEEFVEKVADEHLGERGEKRGEESRVREIVEIKAHAVIREVEKYYGVKADELRGREHRYTEPRYVASYLLRRYCLMGLREIGERVGLHYSAVGNAIRQLREWPSARQAHTSRSFEAKLKNQ